MNPSPRPAILVDALMRRPIWLTESPKTLVAGSITASSGLMASRASMAAGPR